MKILKVMDAEVLLVDLEVNLGDNKQSSPTLCVRYNGKNNYSIKYTRWKAYSDERGQRYKFSLTAKS